MRQVRAISRKDSEPGLLDIDAFPESLGQYFAGFANGEGSFNMSFRPRGDYRRRGRSPFASMSRNVIPPYSCSSKSIFGAARRDSERMASGIRGE
jgi:hypothetical protein